MIPKLLSSILLGLALTTPAPPVQDDLPGSADELLERALRTNPQILLAQAKLQQAQAELNAARFEVTLKVLDAWRERELLAGKLDLAKIQLSRTSALAEKGMVEQGEIIAARQKVLELRSKLDANKDQLRYLAGIERIPKGSK